MGPIHTIEKSTERLVAFIREFADAAGFSRLVIGLSGGIDSSLSAALGAKALGAENLLGLIMPYASSSPESEAHARLMAEQLGIAVEKIEISPMVDAYFGDGDISSLRRGNKCARERMSILFDIAGRDGRLVLGTSNKTEICLGYSTWYGDGACSLNPLGGLYKRDVRALAGHMGVPEAIIAKKPSADLWPGQTDEEELGLSYDTADEILQMIIEDGERDVAALTTGGVDERTIRHIVERINGFVYKRAVPATDLLGGNPIPDRITLT